MPHPRTPTVLPFSLSAPLCAAASTRARPYNCDSGRKKVWAIFSAIFILSNDAARVPTIAIVSAPIFSLPFLYITMGASGILRSWSGYSLSFMDLCSTVADFFHIPIHNLSIPWEYNLFLYTLSSPSFTFSLKKEVQGSRAYQQVCVLWRSYSSTLCRGNDGYFIVHGLMLGLFYASVSQSPGYPSRWGGNAVRSCLLLFCILCGSLQFDRILSVL